MNEKTLMKLEVLLDLVKITEEALISTAEESSNDSDDYTRGMVAGIKLAVSANKRRFEKLETLIRKEQGFMEEDVDLSGGEEIA